MTPCHGEATRMTKIKRQKVPSVGNNEIVDKNGVTNRIYIWIMSFGSLFTSVYLGEWPPTLWPSNTNPRRLSRNIKAHSHSRCFSQQTHLYHSLSLLCLLFIIEMLTIPKEKFQHPHRHAEITKRQNLLRCPTFMCLNKVWCDYKTGH